MKEGDQVGHVIFGKRASWRDRLWLKWHSRKGHATTSWGVPLDEAPYWTCSCKPKKRFYPRRIKQEQKRKRELWSRLGDR